MKVLVVGDDPLARSGLVARLDGRVDVVADTAPREAARLADLADVVLRDLGVGDAHQGRVERPTLALVPDAARAADALAARALGALYRDAEPDRVAAALVAVSQGLVVVDPAFAPRRESRPDQDPLTPREAEVLAQLALGLSNKEIADRLGISDHTAKFHVNAIMGKLGATTRTEAVVRAARLGWLLL